MTRDSLQEHFNKLDGLIRELESTGTNMEQSDKVVNLLLTLPEKYDSVITALETMSIDFVKSRLLDAKLKVKNKNTEFENNKDCLLGAMKKGCYECGSHQHF